MKTNPRLNIYRVMPLELSNLEPDINAHRPHVELKCGHFRSDKEAVYNLVFSKARGFINQDTGAGVPYVGLTSVYADRICKIGFSLISYMKCIENGEDFGRIKAFIDYVQGIGWRRFVGMECVFGDMYDPKTHVDSKYGIIDLDNNGFASPERNQQIYNLACKCASDQCVLMVWNSYGMKVITEKGHLDLMDSLRAKLGARFNVREWDREFYNETFPMCCDYLFLERK